MKRRVVITGMGAVSPVGNNVNEMFSNMVKGVNGIDHITYFDTTNFKVKVAGEIKSLNFEDYFDKREIRRSDRVMLLGTVAAIEAYNQSGLKPEDYDPYSFGVYVTSGIGGLNTIQNEVIVGIERGYSRMSPFFIPNSIVNMTGGMVAIKLGLKGPNLPIVTACSASTNSIGEAYRAVKDGYVEFAIAGGAESCINEIGIGGFASLKALSTSEDKNRASIPFDKERNGFVMGEGAGALILETLESALKRKATILGEIVGYASTNDAFHMTAPDDEAKGISKAMTFALNDAGIKPDQVGYLNAHGTSTGLNDKLETLGIKNVFKEVAGNLNISSTKSMTGHMLGATGAIESIVCLKALETGMIPPTINYQVADQDCDLNYTPNQSVSKKLEYAMSTNLGFGGHNAVLVFKKWED